MTSNAVKPLATGNTASYADLEIALRRRDERAYTAELRYNAADSEAEQRLIEDGQGVLTFDLAALSKIESSANWKAYGEALSGALFSGIVGSAFGEARRNAQSKAAILRVRLSVEPGAAELNSLHWESIKDPEADAPLFASGSIAFSRYLSSMDWRPVRSRPRAEMKALVVISSPSNINEYGKVPLSPIPIEGEDGELARAKTALGKIAVDTLVSPGGASLDRIIDKLREGYDILYLVCHGQLIEVQPRTWEPKIYLEKDDSTEVKAVAGAELVRRIQDLAERPRLVVLASCQSAGSQASDPAAIASAMGPQLARAGIPAVVAMRGNVSMTTAAAFLRRFFEELIVDGQIDRAMCVARQVVREASDYWIPVLYMRLRSGRIWYVPGFSGKFENWRSICGFVSKGAFVPIVGPELSEDVFGSPRDIAEKLAADWGFPLSALERADPAKVAQYIYTKDSLQALRDAVRDVWFKRLCTKYGRLAGSDPDPPVLLDRIVTEMMADANNPFRILAGLKATVYVSASADPLLQMSLLKADPPRTPSELVSKWRDERRDNASEPEESSAPTWDKPLLYYAYGKSQYEDTWVLTEDDFFDYLIRTSKNKLMPKTVAFALTTNSLMFLGFPLDDWKFRILFRMILDLGGSELIKDPKQINHVGVQVNPDETTLADATRAKRYLENYFGTAPKVDIYWGTAADFLRDLERELKQYQAENPVVAAAPAKRRVW